MLLPYSFALLISISVTSQTLTEVRKEFHKAVMTPEKSREFHNFIKNIDEPSPTILAYQAVSEALLAQVLWNPFSKFSQVMKYEKKIKQAVVLDNSNIEIRFLRLAIEYNLPSFLAMNTHIDEDLDMILMNMESVASINVDPDYGRYIFYFLESTELCTDDQIMAMRKSLAQASF